jgi:hypothetical protein
MTAANATTRRLARRVEPEPRGRANANDCGIELSAKIGTAERVVRPNAIPMPSARFSRNSALPGTLSAGVAKVKSD